ncbi:hypothetical protein [Rubellicoccus peritrichatus]|uniref:N-acetylglucosamine-6-phosphate deacetylase n=1 Tax=Rubellicoccus peritrichatus TaxID=3080537 RepID=A0AAQ3LDG3_9BACT|nr:hypothetical protein [Puniceicoccus sp. CR14]WOO41548.1 hypothetical protein RZN69_00505 [Puniceicoccus sp. CR14]
MSEQRIRSLFDIQVNGFAGVDYQSNDLTEQALRCSVDALHRHQTQRIFLTLITDSIDNLCRKLERVETIRQVDEKVAETICGYHIEGPYLSTTSGYSGAHNPDFMHAPQLAEFELMQAAANGNIRMVTLAPELPGAAEFISAVTANQVRVSLGHTDASDHDIELAISLGATLCTHLGNGIPQQLHRHNNVVQSLLADDRLIAFLIPDGIHLPPSTLKNFFRAKPPGKALFTTDCMAAAGALPGSYRLADLTLEVGADGVVRQPGQDNFAGSSLTPDRGVDNVACWLGITHLRARELFSTEIAKLFDIELPYLELETF